ncbi:hypothetical protein BCR34DRAFT_571286 [Clohesyomyces aquaticus]|uniref:Uncharacterized protein n=1 Tax=Clohesyomyces aquaticus TaxID=1231657 RepID=A0A1Y1Z8D1_9PLEO|nr:hypothetical protein BCR34DRAFT_571286 [Clohesyomyces aquaticus]
MLQCQLHNSTYRTKFDCQNGVEHVKIDLHERGLKAPIINFVRSYWGGDPNCATLHVRTEGYGRKCDEDTSLASQLTYQSILQTFTTLITSDIVLDNTTDGLLNSSQIRSTSLVNTKELEYLTDWDLHVKSSRGV